MTTQRDDLLSRLLTIAEILADTEDMPPPAAPTAWTLGFTFGLEVAALHPEYAMAVRQVIRETRPAGLPQGASAHEEVAEMLPELIPLGGDDGDKA